MIRAAPRNIDVRGCVDRGPAQKADRCRVKSACLKRMVHHSKESAEIRTPDPNAMMPAITLWGMGATQASIAPSTKAEPLRAPHNPAWMANGTLMSFSFELLAHQPATVAKLLN